MLLIILAYRKVIHAMFADELQQYIIFSIVKSYIKSCA